MNEEIVVLNDKDKARCKIHVWHGSSSGWINMVKELSGNSLDVFAKQNNNITNEIHIIIHNKNKIEYIDTGVGIPINGIASDGTPNYKAIFETPFAGSNYNNETATVGTNGVFLWTLTMTCEDIEYYIARPDKNVYNIAYHKGDKVKDLNIIDKSDKTYSRLVFSLDTDVWDNPNFTFEEIKSIVKGQASLSNVKITLEDKENNLKEEYYFKNGIEDYFKELTNNKTMITDNILITKSIDQEMTKNNMIDKINIKLLFNFSNDSENDIQKDFLNTADLILHGTIQDGIILGLKNSIHKWLKDNNKYEKKDKNITLEDVQNGLNYICDVKSLNCEYVSQVKQQTLSPHYKTALKNIIEEYMEIYFLENKLQTEKLCLQILINSRARISSDKTRQNLKKTLSEKVDGINNRISNLADCKYHGEGSEIFIAEGLSAKGSLVLSRNPKNQAIYPIRGKILNCLKATPKEIFNSPIITDLIKTLGCGVSFKSTSNKTINNFDINKLRYERICISSDEDPDGKSIQVLVLTMIYVLMRELLYKGHVYITKTPLFVIIDNNTDEKFYASSDREKDEIRTKLNNNCSINRVKGLAELSSEDMERTGLNPKTRNMVKVTVEDVENMIKQFNRWMDIDVEDRKDFIINNLHKYINDEE